MELAADLEWPRIGRKVLLMPILLGFFFAFRLCLIYLFFQSNQATGSAATVILGVLLLAATIVLSMGNDVPSANLSAMPTTIKWVLAFLGFAILSALWSTTESIFSAIAYWVGLVSDVAMVWFVCRLNDTNEVAIYIMKGFVCGAGVVATIAWVLPTTADLRLGNDDFLHPNALGWLFALTTLFAQYLSRRERAWRWICLAMGVTLLRTLSKTSIAAFVIAETFYVVHDSKLSRRTRMQIGIIAISVVICFWGLIESYADIYATEGNSPETLTGRTFLWTMTLTMAMERPWFGHGLHSFSTAIPAMGTFAPWHAHNELIQQFFVYGAVGVFLVIGIYVSLYRQAHRVASGGLKTLVLAVVLLAMIRGLADTERFDLSLPLWLFVLLSFFLAQQASSERLSHG